MKKQILCALLIVLTASFLAGCAARDTIANSPAAPPNEYILRITYIGTRGITYHGRLYIDGHERTGRQKGAVIYIHGYQFVWQTGRYWHGWEMQPRKNIK